MSPPGRWKLGHHRASVPAMCAWCPHCSAGPGVAAMSLQRQDEGRGCCRDGLGVGAEEEPVHQRPPRPCLAEHRLQAQLAVPGQRSARRARVPALAAGPNARGPGRRLPRPAEPRPPAGGWPPQVGGPAGWPHARARGEAFGPGLGAGTPGCAARRRDGVGPAPAGMGMPWFGRCAGERMVGAECCGTGQGVECWESEGCRQEPIQPSIPALRGILVLGEEETQPPRPSLPPAKPAVITARRLCCWQNE